MSIQDADKARERQQNQRAAKREREAQIRPNAMHRAVMFLLKAATENNPDLSEEAAHHMSTLDSELANANEVPPAELIESPDTKPAVVDVDAKPDTAAAIRQSKRFKRTV